MSMIQYFFASLGVVALTYGSFTIFNWISRQSQVVIEGWAEGQNFTLLAKEMRLLRHGPFLFRTGKNQRVYYLTLLDKTGLQRSAYLRVGDFFGRMRPDTIKVIWEDS